MKKILLVALASASLMLVACQSVSSVVPAGNGTYMVGSEVRGGFSSWAEVRALTLNRASEYCAGQGKEMEQVDSKTRGARGWTPQEAELTFRCNEPKKS
ncbi:hypothetical protein [Cupriavidus sp. CP313]